MVWVCLVPEGSWAQGLVPGVMVLERWCFFFFEKWGLVGGNGVMTSSSTVGLMLISEEWISSWEESCWAGVSLILPWFLVSSLTWSLVRVTHILLTGSPAGKLLHVWWSQGFLARCWRHAAWILEKHEPNKALNLVEHPLLAAQNTSGQLIWSIAHQCPLWPHAVLIAEGAGIWEGGLTVGVLLQRTVVGSASHTVWG